MRRSLNMDYIWTMCFFIVYLGIIYLYNKQEPDK